MSLGRDLDQALARMVLTAEGATTPYGDVKLRRRHREPAAPRRVNALAEEWAGRARALLAEIERELAAAEQEVRDTGAAKMPRRDSRSPYARARRHRILDHVNEGRSPTWVAFVEGVGDAGVRRARQSQGLDPATGHRLPGARLTSRQLPEEDTA